MEKMGNQNTLEGGAGQAHKFTKQGQVEHLHKPQAPEGGFNQSSIAAEATAHWGKVWKAEEPLLIAEAAQAIADLRSHVLQSGEPQRVARLVTPTRLRETARRFSTKTAIGADALEIWLVGIWPDEVLEPLCDIIRHMILTLQWSQQLLCAWMVLLPKKLGGFRTIAILPSIVRITMKMVCFESRAWGREEAIQGDTAAPGRQPMAEIASRFARLEAAHTLGRYAATTFWDMSHFFDGVNLQMLAEDVRRHGFPGIAAVMALSMHTAPRRLRIGDAYGPELETVGRGMLAGCSSSTSLARLYLLAPLRTSTLTEEDVELGIHVDDVCQSAIGDTEHEVIEKGAAAGIAFATHAASKRLDISSKSVVVASSFRLAKRLAARVRAAGVPLTAVRATDDLGVGCSPGRRTVTTINRRLRLGLHRASRAALLRRSAGRGTAKLFSTGVRPQALYGAVVAGLVPPQRKRLLAAARRVAGPCGLMPCQLSATFLRLGVLPLPQAQKEQLAVWCQVWDKSKDRQSLTKAWRAIRDCSQNKTVADAWKNASGPVAATIATLREIEWQPTQPDFWVATEQRAALLDAPEPHARVDVLHEAELDAQRAAWRRASVHFGGGGLEQGIPSFEAAKVAKRRLAKLAKTQSEADTAERGPREARPEPTASLRLAALEACNAGGCTVGERYSVKQACPRCGAFPETPGHRYFACPANEALKDIEPSLPRSSWVAKQFEPGFRGRALEPCLWIRGILPANRYEHLAADSKCERRITIGDFEDAVSRSGGVFFTDGSGGRKHSCKPLQRVGAGGAAFAEQHGHLVSFGLILADVPGKQSVPRAETWAGSVALRACPSNVTKWWCDASYTTSGTSTADAVDARTKSANGDVWCALRQAMQCKGLEAATKVKAHRTLAEVDGVHFTFDMYFGNALADIAADLAAGRWQENVPVIRQAEQDFGIAVLINLRLAVVEGHVWAHTASQRVPRPLFEPIPAAIDTASALSTARATVDSAGHKLYNLKGNVACARCQKVRGKGKAHLWATLRCIPPRPWPAQSPPEAQTRPEPPDSEPAPSPAEPEVPRRRITGKRADPGFNASGPKRSAQATDADAPLLPTPAAGSKRASEGTEAPAALKAPRREAQPEHRSSRLNPLDLEDDPFEDHPEDEYFEDDLEQPDDAQPEPEPGAYDEDTVTVSAAKAARREHRKAFTSARAANAQTLSHATREAVLGTMAASWASALESPDVRRTTGPPWAALAGPGHSLYTLGGIVGCSRCGGIARLNITKSLLAKACRQHVISPQGFDMLVRGRLPTNYRKAGWPDGGEELRQGFSIAKMQPD